ncbi:Fic family protein [Duganella sp. LX20W]|uniref:Fic family protein n=1 Tax=Rugamonas brunnea TaxID=2758569 RepID=A0A7W2EPC5_9BURK|nr:Fic family protein [Rugamonas brunnea]MBA5636167.1 Fic family protein [Rugamonas brunnea]
MDGENQSEKPPEWMPHESPAYDEILRTSCATEMQRLAAASSEERLRFISDPREVHSRMYAGLAPEGYPEYAGTYRGTLGTTLEGRRSRAYREDGRLQDFSEPDRVARWMGEVAKQATKIFDLPSGTNSHIVISEIVRLFYVFGLTHPFLDGNGHIQRLIFAACVMERTPLQLLETWTIHPRPYDIEIKLAFEKPTPDARHIALFKVLAAYISA